MDFKDQIKQIGERVTKLKDQIQTEEATKTALIMPFIQCLGYDVFSPSEVVPEYITDIGTKKGEKIDYAIFKDSQLIILLECKHWNQNLTLHDNQLLRYFHVSKAKFGVLTNGILYRFYTDLVDANKMDEKPFLEFDITDMRENEIEELKKFHKSYYHLESIVNTASELKYTSELKNIVKQELTNPTENFVKHFAKQVYPSVINAKVLEKFTALTKKSINQYISDLITDRLKTALNKEVELTVKPEEQIQEELSTTKESNIETTVEEMEGFYIVKAILRQKIEGSRIVYRDAQTYFSIILDDNNRKVICRLHLNGKKKYIGVFNEQKVETKVEISSLDEIYKYSNELLLSVDTYEKTK